MTAEAIVIGLMSGTSTDGIDAAAVRLTEHAGEPTIELLGFLTAPYPGNIREGLLALASGSGAPSDLARMNFVLGEMLAEAAQAAIEQAGLQADDVSLVGSHGHTVSHVPRAADGLEPTATMQIGEDVAAGGQGAPLVPGFDFTFLSSPDISRAALNIGGIANATILRAGCSLDDVVAFDTGPGNMPIDAAVRLMAPGHGPFDRDGRLAAAGVIQDELLKWILAHPYFARTPPKSCGREEFGEPFVTAALAQMACIAPEDFIATITEACGRAAGEAIARYQSDSGEPWEIIVSGGGAHNATLVATIERHAEMPVRASDELGIPVEAKEAMAFAYLAWETVREAPTQYAKAGVSSENPCRDEVRALKCPNTDGHVARRPMNVADMSSRGGIGSDARVSFVAGDSQLPGVQLIP